MACLLSWGDALALALVAQRTKYRGSFGFAQDRLFTSFRMTIFVQDDDI
jgi:hypothetical protein